MVRVIDGDPIVVDPSADLPGELVQLRVRLRGVDAPEGSHCACCLGEDYAAARATGLVETLLASSSTVVVRDPRRGKWGGRMSADLIADGDSLSVARIETGYSRAYDGSERAS